MVRHGRNINLYSSRGKPTVRCAKIFIFALQVRFSRLSTIAFVAVGLLSLTIGGCLETTVGDETEVPSTIESSDSSSLVQTTPADERRHWVVRLPSVEAALEFNREHGEVLTNPAHDWGDDDERWWKGWFDGAKARDLHAAGFDIEAYSLRSTDCNQDADGLQTRCQASHEAETCPGEDPVNDTFCGYMEPVSRCADTISTEIGNLASNHSFVSDVFLTTTHGGRELLGLRIGNITANGEAPSPQVIIIGAQHGNELIAAEIPMRLIRYFVDAYAKDLDGVKDLLSDRTLTIVPVLNPDGYDHYFRTDGAEAQRQNGRICPDDPQDGVDLNRNHPFAWGHGSLNTTCGGMYLGPSPISEPETDSIRQLIGHDTSLDGEYTTAAVVNLHAAGNLLTFTSGFDTTLTECGVDRSNHRANCSAPDLDLLYELFGTERPSKAFLLNERSYDRNPYETGQWGRLVNYGVGGGLMEDVHYGQSLPGTTSRALGALVELYRGPCRGGDGTINLSEAQIERMFKDQIELTVNLLENAPATVKGTFLEERLGHPFALPHIYRLDPAFEHPRARVSARKHHSNVDMVTQNINGGVYLDRTIDGTEYRTWYWEPDDDPFVFPGLLKACVGGGELCGTAVFDDGMVDLCSASEFSLNGWTFEGRSYDDPAEQCYFQLNAPNASASLTRDPKDLSEMIRTRLVFSYELNGGWGGSDATVDVLVSNNRFQNCTWEEGTGCRIIKSYMHEHLMGGRILQDTFRTETFDVSDFDSTSDVQVRFEASNADSNDTMRVYDIHFAGWKKTEK